MFFFFCCLGTEAAVVDKLDVELLDAVVTSLVFVNAEVTDLVQSDAVVTTLVQDNKTRD